MDRSLEPGRIGNRVFITGGDSGGALAWVQSGELQMRGGISFWEEEAALLEPTQGHALAADDQSLYLVAPSGKVYSASVDGVGRTGVWRELAALPGPREHFGLIAHAGTLHVIGGSQRSSLSAPILPDGTLGEWRESAALPTELHGLWVGAVGCNLYAVGGFDGVGRVTAYVARLQQ